MNETLQIICWVALGVLAFIELSRLYYRVHILEKTVDKCVDVIEHMVKEVKAK
jgi:hypothetical protein